VLRGTAPGGDPASTAAWLPTAFVRLAGASALVLLRLGEAATLAAAAGVRSVLDATQAPAPATPPVPVPAPPVAPVAVAEAEPAAVVEVVAEPVADVVPLPVEPAPTSDVVLVQPEPTSVAVLPEPELPVEADVQDTDVEADVEAETEDTDVEDSQDVEDLTDVEADTEDSSDVEDSSETEDSSDTEEPEVDEPPVPLWDQLSLASIRGRLRRFSLDELHTLHAYETQHSNRPQVVAMLDKRIQRVEQLPVGASVDTE
jgi:hypothetical protein